VIKLNKNRDLTTGSITGGLWSFAVPLMLGNVFQQFYSLADTWMVGKYVGDNALAAVGLSYTLLTFLNSVIIGLEPVDCVAFEDSINGIKSAHAAGMTTVMVPDLSEPTDEIKPMIDFLCTDLSEAIKHL
jgi:hypothetical protein